MGILIRAALISKVFLTMWRELFTRAASAERASKQLAPQRGLKHGFDMSSRRVAERAQVVSAFQARNDSAFAGCIGRLSQSLRHPFVACVIEQQLSERIGLVRVKAGRDEHQIRREVF